MFSSWVFSEFVKDKDNGGNGWTYIHWMFPELQTVNLEGVSRKVDLIIKTLSNNIRSLNGDMMSHGHKSGALDKMLINQTCPQIRILHRGGFDLFEYTSTAYCYAAMKKGVSEARRALNE